MMSGCPFSVDYERFTAGDPAPVLARYREESPVVKLTAQDPNLAGYLITRREDVLKIVADLVTFSSVGNPQGARFGDFNEQVAAIYRREGWPIAPVLVWIDPPAHTKFRRVVDRIFTPKQVEGRSGHIQLCIDKVIAAFNPDGRVEAISQFALPVPAMVMTREFGAPEDEFLILIEATNAVGAAVDHTRTAPAEIQAVVEAAAHGATKFQHYMLPKIEHARSHPENTMLSELVNAREEDRPAFTTEQILSLLITFLIAATHSTTGALGWAVYMLAKHPDIQARLRREPEKIDAFNEEVLRMHGTVSTSYRTATRDTEVNGTAIPKGAQILLRWDSANFDGAFWNEPEKFNIDRKNGRAHATFGYGPHFCVGNTLARREMLLGVRTLLNKFRNIELDADAPPPRVFPSTNVHFLENLPLRLTI
jgi:cytochrome P450